MKVGLLNLLSWSAAEGAKGQALDNEERLDRIEKVLRKLAKKVDQLTEEQMPKKKKVNENAK